MYPIIGEPLADGELHCISTLDPWRTVVGAIGALGYYAAKILIS